jgi:hypothetical protein
MLGSICGPSGTGLINGAAGEDPLTANTSPLFRQMQLSSPTGQSSNTKASSGLTVLESIIFAPLFTSNSSQFLRLESIRFGCDSNQRGGTNA